MKLVIVESPTKAKTLSGILGKDYEVKASMGHIRDLPKKGLGVDVEHNYEPEYEIPAKSKKTATELKKLSLKKKIKTKKKKKRKEGRKYFFILNFFFF